ncbi:MAG: hypothetical protein AB8G11_01230 [Saprospiraceae bacterium]
MKNLFIFYFLFFGILTIVNAQDTIIDTKDYYLQINKYINGEDPFESLDSNRNMAIFEYQWNGHPLTYALKTWMSILEVDTIEYHIDESISNQIDYFKFVNKDREYSEPIQPNDSSKIEYHLDKEDRQITYYVGYAMIYREKRFNEKEQHKKIAQEALKAFCEFADLEIKIVKKEVNYWKLELVDTVNASFSYDQNKHWKRNDLEEYIYYERIPYERVVDLLSRKVDAFVKPISETTKKFDIRMPYSDDVFDLKYAMIDHGFELTEVIEEIDVIVISEVN